MNLTHIFTRNTLDVSGMDSCSLEYLPSFSLWVRPSINSGRYGHHVPRIKESDCACRDALRLTGSRLLASNTLTHYIYLLCPKKLFDHISFTLLHGEYSAIDKVSRGSCVQNTSVRPFREILNVMRLQQEKRTYRQIVVAF